MKHILHYSFLLVFAIVFFACGTDESKKATNEESEKQDVIADDSGFGESTFEGEDPLLETYYQIPAPDEIFAFIGEEGLDFKKKLLLNEDDLVKFIDSRAQTVNMGVYSADLAYCVAFEEYQSSVIYFAIVRKLGEKIGISSVFDEKLLKRVETNLNNIDSLEQISNESYFRVIDYLVDVENGKTLIYMTLGGWIETFYLVTNLVDDFNKDQSTVQRVADQKYTLEILMQCAEEFSDDEFVSGIYKELEAINKIFNDTNVQKIEKSEATGANTAIGTEKITLTEKQFFKIRSLITNLRNRITETSK